MATLPSHSAAIMQGAPSISRQTAKPKISFSIQSKARTIAFSIQSKAPRIAFSIASRFNRKPPGLPFTVCNSRSRDPFPEPFEEDEEEELTVPKPESTIALLFLRILQDNCYAFQRLYEFYMMQSGHWFNFPFEPLVAKQVLTQVEYYFIVSKIIIGDFPHIAELGDVELICFFPYDIFLSRYVKEVFPGKIAQMFSIYSSRIDKYTTQFSLYETFMNYGYNVSKGGRIYEEDDSDEVNNGIDSILEKEKEDAAAVMKLRLSWLFVQHGLESRPLSKLSEVNLCLAYDGFIWGYILSQVQHEKTPWIRVV